VIDGREALGRYREHLELRGYAARTIAGRRWLLDQFLDWLGARELSVPVVEEYRRHRVQRVNTRGRRDTARTVNLHLEALRHFFAFLELPPALSKPLATIRAPRRLPQTTLLHADVLKMLHAVPLDTPLHVRDRAILELFYSSALRREELIQVKIEDLDLEGGLLRVEQGKGGKDRMVPVGRHAVDWLRRYLAHARPRLASTAVAVPNVFLSKSGRPLDGPSVRDVVIRWATAAGLEKPVSPHALRRSCATEMIRHGASAAHVKELLGHEDFTSIDAYVRLVVTDLKEALEKHHPRERLGEG